MFRIDRDLITLTQCPKHDPKKVSSGFGSCWLGHMVVRQAWEFEMQGVYLTNEARRF